MNNKDFEVTLLSKEDISSWYGSPDRGIGNVWAYWTITQADAYYTSLNHGFWTWGKVNGRYGRELANKSLGVRPVIETDDLEKLFKTYDLKKYSLTRIQFGEFIDFSSGEIKINDISFLKPTGKEYSLPLITEKSQETETYDLSKVTEYDYNGQKIANFCNKFFLVRPIDFFVDEENNRLISANILFTSPINMVYDINIYFEKTDLYKFLNNEFIEILCSSLYRENKVQDETLLQPIEDNVQDEILLKQLEDENKKLKDEISRKKALLKKLKEIIAQNETFKVQSANLDSDIKKEIGKVKVLKRN